MRKHYPVSEQYLAKDYTKYKPKENRYYFKSNIQLLKNIKHWGHIRAIFISEFYSILENEIMVTPTRYSTSYKHDVLFEYLIIKAITFLEICLKYCCDIYVKKLPERAKLLLTDIYEKKDLSIQILSNYSFANAGDIEHVFSTLWGKNYFQVLRHRSEEHKSSIGYEPERPHRASPLYKKMGMFKQLLKMRNELVHQNIHRIINSKTVRKNLLTTVYDVVYLTYSEQSHLPYDDKSLKEIIPRY